MQSPRDKIPDLLYAIKMKDPLVVNYLLAHGASVHMKDGHGATALHYAAAAKNPELVELFLKRGVDMYAVADASWIIKTVRTPEGEIIRTIELPEIPQGGSAYEVVIENDDLISLSLFIKHGLRVDALWYEQRRWMDNEFPHAGVYACPGFLALLYGKPNCLKLLAEQRSFSLPDEDCVWYGLTNFPIHYDDEALPQMVKKREECDLGKGECLSWLMDRFLFFPSPEILKYDLADAYNSPSILKVLEEKFGNLDFWQADDSIEDEWASHLRD
jgi:hypothetical protein